MSYLDASGKPIPRDMPRALSVQELKRLARNGFADLAETIVAGTCGGCGLNRTSDLHRASCELAQPLPAPTVEAVQPWVPRPSRRTRDGATATG
jgi:hypothetical protein